MTLSGAVGNAVVIDVSRRDGCADIDDPLQLSLRISAGVL